MTRRTETGIPARFAASRDSVWAALLFAYRDVGLSPDFIDTDASIVAQTKLPIRRVFQGQRVSMLFNCGETPTGGNLADVGQVVASVRSQIGGEFDHPVVYTLVDAYVIPDGGRLIERAALREHRRDRRLAAGQGEGAPRRALGSGRRRPRPALQGRPAHVTKASPVGWPS